jgi:hypothetical protein
MDIGAVEGGQKKEQFDGAIHLLKTQKYVQCCNIFPFYLQKICWISQKLFLFVDFYLSPDKLGRKIYLSTPLIVLLFTMPHPGRLKILTIFMNILCNTL